MGGPAYEERLVEALVMPGKDLGSRFCGPTLLAEMAVIIAEHGAPVFSAQIIDLTNQVVVHRSKLYSSITYADLEWVHCVGKSIPSAHYDEALKGVL